MPLITTRDSTSRGGKSTPTVLSWTSFPLIVPNSIRSNECGSSHAVAACTIATSKILRTLSAQSKRNLQIGQLATMCYADYAQLLKTLCLVRRLGEQNPGERHKPQDCSTEKFFSAQGNLWHQATRLA